MATKSRGFPSEYTETISAEPQQTIIIERRQEIGRVTLDPYGTRNPLELAFELAARYVANETGPDAGVNVEFVYIDHTWSVASRPNKQENTTDGTH